MTSEDAQDPGPPPAEKEQPPMLGPKPAKPVPSLKRTLWIAAVLFTIDTQIYGTPVLCGLLLMFGSWILLLRVFLARKNRPLRNRRLKSIPIYALTVAATICVCLLQDRLLRARAETVIAACERYRTAHGSLPKGLEDLVPGYLSKLPSGSQGLAFIFSGRSFHYYNKSRQLGRGPTLWYYERMFRRQFYDFDKKEWWIKGME